MSTPLQTSHCIPINNTLPNPRRLGGAAVAIKVCKGALPFQDAAWDEIDSLRAVAAACNGDRDIGIVPLLDSFDHAGLPGIKRTVPFPRVALLGQALTYSIDVCIVMPKLGCDLRVLGNMFRAKGGRGMPIPLVKMLTKRILVAVDHLHRRCLLIHADLKPENILLCNAPDMVRFGVPRSIPYVR